MTRALASVALLAAVLAQLAMPGSAAPRSESRFRNAKRQCNQTAPEEPQEPELGTFTNPTIDGNYADPFVFSFNNAYYLLATESDGSVSIFKSNNFANWRGAEHKRLWMPPNPPVWAPEMHNIDGNFYVYCALPDGPADADHRTHVLKGTDPTDPTAPFEDLGVISTPDLNYMIDATVLKYGGKNYLIWSGKENPQTETIQHIYIAEMSSPSTLIGERVDLHAPFHTDGSRIDWQWSPNQYGVNEGPQILQNGNQTFLIYSACGSWDPCYSLAIMGLDGDDKNPLDPAAWWRNDDGPVFTKSDKTVGTGHASFTTDTRGTPYIIYHAWPVEASGGWGARTVYTQPFNFGSDGRPIFPSPVAQGVEVPAPAGF